VLARIDLRGQTLSAAALRRVVPRASLDVDVASDTARPIVQDVRDRGAEALYELGERLDGVRPPHLRVPQAQIDKAVAELDPPVRVALEEAIRRARLVHGDQVRQTLTTQVVEGGVVSERFVPVDRVGLYVPGGRAVYPSSVIMNVVPAQAAGVPSLAVTSPPQADHGGLPHPTILAACGLLGVDEVYAVGGAQAVAMFAYGVEDLCEPVAMVTGPGNAYVTAAKRLLRGLIGIDSEAGTTEIMIVADETAQAAHVAADLISQAEHDPYAASVLVTTSVELADAVDVAVREQLATTKHVERIATALSGAQSAIVLVDSIEQAVDVANGYAAEHLEIHTADAAAVAARIRNAGAIFVGAYAPVSLGDYAAGSNHVLPTGGSGAHSGGLSVQTFLRGIHVVEYTEQALAESA
jgi:histidinol dehydrogenase